MDPTHPGSAFDDRVLIESPDYVEVDVELAGVGSRFIAAIVDAAIIAALEFAILVVTAAVMSLVATNVGWMQAVGSVGAAIAIGASSLVLLGYHIAGEMWMNGQSPGKRLMDIRVVKDNGQPIRFADSALRNFIRIFEFAAGAYTISIISILASRQCKRIGDFAAGTIVARATKRAVPAHLAVDVSALPLPPEMRQAVQTGISRVTQAEYEFVSDFLQRCGGLAPPMANRMAVQTGWELMNKLGIPPQGENALSPEVYYNFLYAVAATYARKSLDA